MQESQHAHTDNMQTLTTCRPSQHANTEASLTANRLQGSKCGLHLECCPAAAFENIVQALYTNVVPKPKSQCSKSEQLGVSFTAGYLAGILCAAISHPADNLVSKLNASKVCMSRSVLQPGSETKCYKRTQPAM